jgi:hypothetical protein
MGDEEMKWLIIGPFLVLSFFLALWVGRYLRPKCRACEKGRLIVVDRWENNDKLRCDHCGEECWDMEY